MFTKFNFKKFLEESFNRENNNNDVDNDISKIDFCKEINDNTSEFILQNVIFNKVGDENQLIKFFVHKLNTRLFCYDF